MNATQKLHGLGQSLWLDNITRNLLQGGLLRRYIDELSVTGLTSNPTIFDHAIKNSSDYDVAIREKLEEGKSGEQLFFELALEDLTQAADLFRPIYDLTCGVDGWVSLEVSPLLAHNTKVTLTEAKELHARGKRPIENVQITMAEDFGVQGRGAFYDETGAIRDVIQNHLFQVLANLAMEPPPRTDSESIRDEKVKVLKAIPPLESKNLVRGQFRGYRKRERRGARLTGGNLCGAAIGDRFLALERGSLLYPGGKMSPGDVRGSRRSVPSAADDVFRSST